MYKNITRHKLNIYQIVNIEFDIFFYITQHLNL